MQNIIYRPALISDIQQITAIYEEAVRFGTASFELDPPTDDEMQRRYETLMAGHFPYYVAEHEKQILGYSYAGPYRLRPAYDWTLEDAIYMHKDARGKGIGKELLRKVIEESAKRGYCQMLANIGGSDNIGSIKLHESLGFCHIGTFPKLGWKFERWHNSVMMQLSLRKDEAKNPAKLVKNTS